MMMVRWLVVVVFTEAFLLDLTAHFFRRNHYSTAKIQWAIFVAGARGVRSLCFVGRRHDSVDRRFNEV